MSWIIATTLDDKHANFQTHLIAAIINRVAGAPQEGSVVILASGLTIETRESPAELLRAIDTEEHPENRPAPPGDAGEHDWQAGRPPQSSAGPARPPSERPRPARGRLVERLADRQETKTDTGAGPPLPAPADSVVKDPTRNGRDSTRRHLASQDDLPDFPHPISQ